MKHVQTELDETEYEEFRTSAKERGLTLKQASHEALTDWAAEQQRVDPSDPAFTVLDELDDETLPASAETDAREESDLVDDWSGDDIEFVFATEPDGQS
jgi:hypothetical protein